MQSTILVTSYSIAPGGVLQIWANFELYPRESLETSLSQHAGKSTVDVKPDKIYLAIDPNGK
jgi:hypothetical protein